MPDFTLHDGTLLRGGAFRIIRFLNAGGFGCTYEAVHTGLKRRVAIKEFFVRDFCNRDPQTSGVYVSTLSKQDLAEKLKRKFLDEASAVANLNHPGIVRVTDVFEENGTAYFVMDFIEGRSLDQIIADKGYLPENEALHYIRQAANALAYVHGTKRLHLDIKPGNIMVDGAGRAVLIDFGVSKQYDEAAGENTSTLLGRTPGYAPIEQMSPKLRTFTPATDIYALGATLYKAVTGVTPPDATELHNDEELLFPPSLSAPVVNAIEAATRMRAKDRPQSIADFLSILDAPSSVGQTSTQPISTPTQPLPTPTQPLSTPTQPLPTPTQPLPTPTPIDDPRRSSPSRGSGDSHKKQKSHKKLLLAASIAAIAILAALLFLLPSKSSKSSTSSLIAETDPTTISSPDPETLAEDPVAPPAPAPVQEEKSPAQDKTENYTGLSKGSTFSYGGLNYKVTFPGKVEVAKNKGISGTIQIPAKVIHNSYTYDVTSIGQEAFYNCSSLSSVTIPNSVTSIGNKAFFNCSSLSSVTIPNSVTSIGDRAFDSCDNLSAFHGKFASADNRCLVVNGTLNSFAPKGITSYSIPNSVTSIGIWAFGNCSSLSSVTIANSVTSIGRDAFWNCSSLASVTIPNTVTSIGDGAFGYCSSLSSVTIPNSVTSIGDKAFSDCSSLSSVTIPNSVTSIGQEAFYKCSSLSSVTIPNSVTSIGDRAFEYCGRLSSVSIPNSVTSIGNGAFFGCSSLASVTISNSVTSIGESAFDSCDNLSAFHGKFASADNRCLVVNGTLISFAPKGLTSYSIPNSVTSIGNKAFQYCTSLSSVSIPNSVTSIGSCAFHYCSSLSSVSIPNSVTSIGDRAFWECSRLSSVTIANPNCKIDSSAFSQTPFAGKTNPADFR